jgi:hypothetical protein
MVIFSRQFRAFVVIKGTFCDQLNAEIDYSYLRCLLLQVIDTVFLSYDSAQAPKHVRIPHHKYVYTRYRAFSWY